MADVSLLVISRMDLHLRLRRPGTGVPAARPYAVTVGDSAGMGENGFHRLYANPIQSNSTKTLDPNVVGASRREACPGRPEGKFVQNCLPSENGLLRPLTVDRDCLRAVPLPPVDNTRVIDYNYKCG